MMVIPSRADGEGPRSCKLGGQKTIRPEMTVCSRGHAKAIERVRGPSARFASLGMTRVAIILNLASPLESKQQT